MALSLKRKMEIGSIRLGWSFMLDSKGNPIGVFPKKRLPTAEEIREMILEELARNGHTVKYIRPADANCVIRVYRNMKYTHNADDCCLIGAFCFIKPQRSSNWVNYDEDGNTQVLDYTKCEIETTFELECIEKIEAEFFDTYVKIS